MMISLSSSESLAVDREAGFEGGIGVMCSGSMMIPPGAKGSSPEIEGPGVRGGVDALKGGRGTTGDDERIGVGV